MTGLHGRTDGQNGPVDEDDATERHLLSLEVLETVKAHFLSKMRWIGGFGFVVRIIRFEPHESNGL